MTTSMTGRLEWDDENLTPGNKKEGGYHNNLYDSDGRLKGSARFIPEHEPERSAADEPAETSGKDRQQWEAPQKLRTGIQAEATMLLAEIVKGVAKDLMVEARPHAERLWKEKGRQALESKRAEAMRDAGLLWERKARPLISRQREKLMTRNSETGRQR
ncbi:hypothetical protein [Rhodococcoides corynebacterioides]|uniref:Uncharacterized protein n=1 Tax=Rhodococcoides corynebacterioides TaxID=53972 RepID=A0ABS7P3K2_9NOCA|nr:hypothetical protein [Rhodococcus corynebacterioides]MBY6366989.1 hypothetical protein [Rhodococcus corynebacterioides]MBY6407250.1 hypothetical protein [Rhodococcus corynebacterioides]